MSILENLKNSELKITSQRQLIVQKIDEFSSPFSAEDLYNQGLKKAKIDLATIYRTLGLFVDKGWLTQMDLGEGRSRYWPTSTQAHAHTLYCRVCQKIELIPGCLLEKQHDALLKKGFTRLTHKVEFNGVCPDCSQTGAP